MREDRYSGTTLPRPVQKLFRMAEREADRAHPERLREQAVAALISDADREIFPRSRPRLREHDRAPGLFDSRDLEEAARSGLEDEIARNLKAGEGTASTNAIRDALRRRGESYARERKCRLIADRNPDAAIASASVKRAFGSRRAHAPLALESDTAGVCGVCGGCLLRAVSARAAGLTLPPLENAFDVYATEDIVDDWNGRKGRMTPGERAIAVRAVSAMAELARLSNSSEGELAVSREARLIEFEEP